MRVASASSAAMTAHWPTGSSERSSRFVETGDSCDGEFDYRDVARMVDMNGDDDMEVFEALDALESLGIVSTGEIRMEAIEYWTIPGSGETCWRLTYDWMEKAREHGYMKHLPTSVQVNFSFEDCKVTPKYFAPGGGSMTQQERIVVLADCRRLLSNHIERLIEEAKASGEQR